MISIFSDVNPDIVCLQEHHPYYKFDELKDLYPYHGRHHSEYKIVFEDKIRIIHNRCISIVDILLPNKEIITVLNSHFPLKFVDKLEYLIDLKSIIKGHNHNNIVIFGDFN